MSTSRLATDWNLPIGLPNCLRVRACAMHSSSCRRITPRQLARMQPRSHSIEHSKIGDAAAFAAEALRDRNAAVVEDHLRHRRRAQAHLVELAADR